MNRASPRAGGLWAALLATWALSASAQQAASERIEPLPRAEWSDTLREAAGGLSPAGMAHLVGAYAHHPELAEVLVPHLRYVLGDSTLPARERSLLALRAIWLTRSDYLWAHRAAAARQAGFTGAELDRIARGPDAEGWNAHEAALLRAADELHVDAFISDSTWQALAARYDVSRMIDVIDTVGALTMHAGAARSLGVALEPGVDARAPSGISHAPSAERTNTRLVGGEPRIPPEQPENGGVSANVFNTFVHNPRGDPLRGAINGHVNGNSTLAPQHRELLLIRIGILCRSEYEYAAHVRAGLQAGLTDADIDMILAGPESPNADATERALLRATDELHERERISAETWAALAETFDTRQLLDVLVAVGGYRSTSMLINSAGVQLDANMTEFRFPPELR